MCIKINMYVSFGGGKLSWHIAQKKKISGLPKRKDENAYPFGMMQP